ncbi:hypothetical protein, partial [Streptomyces sioyaensis]|uniref:hypothetical protein n=1 Tax=Streptomyces sioyaensis TaxID=67364 RepID=UPI001F1CBDD3
LSPALPMRMSISADAHQRGWTLIKVGAFPAGDARRIRCVMSTTCRPAAAQPAAVGSDNASTPWYGK